MRLIDAEELDVVGCTVPENMDAESYMAGMSYVLEKVDGMATIEPEIIRCKDCKHYDGRPCGIVNWYNTATDYCSKRERREDG